MTRPITILEALRIIRNCNSLWELDQATDKLYPFVRAWNNLLWTQILAQAIINRRIRIMWIYLIYYSKS